MKSLGLCFAGSAGWHERVGCVSGPWTGRLVHSVYANAKGGEAHHFVSDVA